MAKKETHSFQTKTKKMLDIMIHSIYTHKEIFLRELISNSADALNKLRFKALTEKNLMDKDEDLRIELSFDKDKRTLTINDNGIGMTHDEVIDNIGTVAQSGSGDLIEKLQEEEDAFDLIGQFGVGFYSSFMVADKVTLKTKASNSTAVKWTSKGDGAYTIEECDKKDRGTKITLHLREGEEFDEILNQYYIERLVKKYSNYVPFPIKMDYKKQVPDEDADDDNATKEVIEEKTLNSMKPIWKKPKGNIDDDEYSEFYKNMFNDWNDPFDIIHTKAEGLVAYNALMYIPKKAPTNYYQKDFKPGIRLYSKQVFIMKHCEELLPEYLHFVKGVVDSPDFSLNISRELLQKDKQINRIGRNLEKKILRKLNKNMKDKREEYEKWWDEFGMSIKNGIYQNPEKKDDLKDLLVFNSTEKLEEKTSLEEYVERMNDNQENIYFLVANNKEDAKNLPQLESVKDKGYEVLFFTDPVDEFLVNFLTSYNGHDLKSLNKDELDFEDEDKNEDLKKESKNLLETIKNNLENKIDEVKLSNRLKSSAVCLVSDKQGMSIKTEELLKQTQNLPFSSNRILEINPDHNIFKIMKKEYDNNKNSNLIKDYSELLYEQAILMEGLPIKNPTKFAEKISKLMVKAKKDK